MSVGDKMFSTNTKILAIFVVAISVLSVTAVMTDDSDAAGTNETYKFYLLNTADGYDNSINGWYSGKGTSPIDALCKVLDKNKISYTGFTNADEGIYFSDSKYISDWTLTEWGTKADGTVGVQYSIWNYNATDGWFRGNTFGTDSDKIYLIVHEMYMAIDSEAAARSGVDGSAAWAPLSNFELEFESTVYYSPQLAYCVYFDRMLHGQYDDLEDYGFKLMSTATEYDTVDEAVMDWATPVAGDGGFDPTKYVFPDGVFTESSMISMYMGFIGQAPIDLHATPQNLVYGHYYQFYLSNTVTSEDSSKNGWISAYGTSVVDAFCNALDDNNITYAGFDKSTPSIAFQSNSILDWTKNVDPSAADLVGPDYVVWSYDVDDGWKLSGNLGTENSRVYYISHENTYKYGGATSDELKVTKSTTDKVCSPYGGINSADGAVLVTAPRDYSAVPQYVVFGPDTSLVLKDYTFIIEDNIGDIPKATYTSQGTNPVNALAIALNVAAVPYTFDGNAKSVYFDSYGDGIIRDWGTSWDNTSADIIGSNYAIWNYNATDGWYMGSSFGKDSDTVYYISYENYFVPTGNTAKFYGIGSNDLGKIVIPATGLYNCYDSWIQLAPRDDMATPENVIFGPEIKDYQFTLANTVASTPSKNTYDAQGTTPVSALANALDQAGITYTFDRFASSVFFGEGDYANGIISDWTTSWDQTQVDIIGANYAIWVYNANDGWYMSDGFGTDKDTIYYISYENYLQFNGPTAQSMGVSKSADGPAIVLVKGIKDGYGMYLQLAPQDDMATPENVVFGADLTPLKDYTFLLMNNITGFNSEINGTYVSKGTTPVNAFANALNYSGIPYTFKYDAASVFFSSKEGKDGYFSDWTTSWDSSAADALGANYAIWIYNENDGWMMGGSLGTDPETVYCIKHENYYKPTGATAVSMGTVVNDAGKAFVPVHGMVADAYGGWIQEAPRDYSATPATVVFGPDTSKVKSYTFILTNLVAATPTQTTYAAVGDTPVIALAQALFGAGISYSFDPYASSVFLSTKNGYIADWATSWDSTAEDLIGPNYSIWDYNATDGWYTGKSLGKDSETTYCVMYENYYTPTGATALSMGAEVNGANKILIPIHGMIGDPYGGWIQAAPMDFSATPDKVVFGPGTPALTEYTFILANTVAATPTKETYVATGDSPVIALAHALFHAGISYTFDPYAASVFFGAGDYAGGIIADWTDSWDPSQADIIGANYAIWVYNANDGWYMSDGFGTEKDTTYYISYENYLQFTGPTAYSMGITKCADGKVIILTTGIMNAYDMYLQLAPQDDMATPENVVFGPDMTSLKEYTFILVNSISGANSGINDTYTTKGTTPVNALANALNYAGVSYTFKYDAASVFFSSVEGGDGYLSDWTTSWDNTTTDVFGANYAIWNYNATDGWFIGNAFGTDPDTVYLISHENYFKPTGISAKAMGVTVSETGVITAPAGLLNSYDYYIQLAPMDYDATPANLQFNPFFFITFDLKNGSDLVKIAGYEGAAVSNVPTPTKEGCEFDSWSPAVPGTFTELDLLIVAVWKVVPVEKEDSVEVDLSEGDSKFVMPATDKAVVVDLPNNSSVTLSDSSAIAGATVDAKIEAVENTSNVKGDAYEFTFEADGVAYNGKMQVTVPYSGSSGKVPVVYYVTPTGETEEMTIVSYTDTSVTFETNHNSVYVVGSSDASISTFTMVAVFAIFVAVVIAAVVCMVESRKLPETA